MTLVGYLAKRANMTAAEKRRTHDRAGVIKALAHPSRVLIAEALTDGELCVCDLTELVGADISTVSRHLSIMKTAGWVEVEKRGRELLIETTMNEPLILILCTGNSCRSHMAEGILHAAAGDLVRVASAGSRPVGFVHPVAIDAMREIGIDLSDHSSKHLETFFSEPVDTVITVCGNAEQACPAFPGQVHRHHWGFDDPAHAEGTAEEILGEFRRVRNEIRVVFEAYATGLRRGQTVSGG